MTLLSNLTFNAADPKAIRVRGIVSMRQKLIDRIEDQIGLSQEELAFRAGMKRSYLSDLERGTRNPSVRALGRLAEALGIEPSQLVASAPD